MKRTATKIALLESGPHDDPMDAFGVETTRENIPAPAAPEAKPEAHRARNATEIARGRWFVLIVVLGILVIGQTPFVVLWALEFGKPTPIVISRSERARRIEMTAAPVIALPSTVTIPVAPEPPRVKIARSSPPGALSGWVDIDVPVSLRISEDGEFLGTTEIDRLMLPVGEHVLDLSSDELHFRVQRVVKINAGVTTTVQLDLPRASLSINAKPWAEVWVDGERVGDTPIGNLLRSIGRHEVVLRHPQLGERREQVLVALNQPAHLSVDLRQQN